jgi:3-hydroxyisobutyrate dehydrogenase
MNPPNLAYLGLGLMGLPMTERLLAAGHRVHVWNRSRDKLAPALAQGALACDTPADAAKQADVVLMCLTDTHAVEQVVFGEHGIASIAGTHKILVDHSSMRPDATRAFAERLQLANDMDWIDAPVSGGAGGAQAGTLAIMCGGREAMIDRVRPVLAAYATNVTRMGPIGAGQTTKLCNQVIVGSTVCVIAEAIRLAQNAGVDAAMLPKALAGGWADSKPFQVFTPRMLEPNSAPLGASRTMLKDLDTALDLGQETGTPLLMAGLAAQIMRIMSAQGKGEVDLARLIDLYRP